MVNKFEKELKDGHFRVAIFGSARIKRGDGDYKKVRALAKEIGRREIDIVTGGGPGLMEAAASGYDSGRKNGKNHSLGLLIKLPKEQRTTKHLDIKKQFHVFSHRLDHFMLLSNAVVVAPGGMGTLLELVYSWQLVQVKQICNIPIILFGKQWEELIKWVKKWPLKNGFMSKEDLDSIFIARTIDEVMGIIDATHAAYVRGGKNICLNVKKYRI